MSQKIGYKDQIEILASKIQEVDAIVVGAASGMSAADGKLYWYKNDDFFYEKFGDFYDKYGFTGVFNGFYYRYKTDEARWAFIARLVHTMFECHSGEAYKNLMDLIKDKNYFVVTTNQDMLFHEVVPEEKLATIQGDWKYMQCLGRCHDAVYPAKEAIYKMNDAINENLEIPTELLPRCPKCGGLMEPWVRGYDFLEGTKYHEEYEKWNDFLMANRNRKVLFLELGVGRMTPMFIQEPFWKMTYTWPDAYYISINPKHALLPQALAHKGMAIHEDIRRTLSDTNALIDEAYTLGIE